MMKTKLSNENMRPYVAPLTLVYCFGIRGALCSASSSLETISNVQDVEDDMWVEKF